MVVSGVIRKLQQLGILTPVNVLVVVYFGVGATVYGTLEKWSTLDSCYFLMTTATTVGYGDFAPTTKTARLFTCFYALIGMTIIIGAISPLITFMIDQLDRAERLITRFLVMYGLMAPPVDTLDMTLTHEQVNARINYTRRYLMALLAPLTIMCLGVLISVTSVGAEDWVDSLYWVIITSTTIGYGDVTPVSNSGKLAVIVYLPISVAAFGQALTATNMITTRRRIREEDHGKIADQLLLEAANGDPDESITEGEFLIMILEREGLVDEDTIMAIRRQFRHLVRHGDSRVPFEMRTFDSWGVFNELVERGRVIQRPKDMRVGSMRGRRILVDLTAKDGGFQEWREAHWMGGIATKKAELDEDVVKAFAKIAEPWSPHIAGDVNDTQLKVVKLQGEFVWHHHQDEDECFLVVRGKMRMRFLEGDVDCDAGEFIVVPRGVEHCPVALSDPCEVLLVERSSTLNTGSAADELGDTVHDRGSVPLTKRELGRL